MLSSLCNWLNGQKSMAVQLHDNLGQMTEALSHFQVIPSARIRLSCQVYLSLKLLRGLLGHTAIHVFDTVGKMTQALAFCKANCLFSQGGGGQTHLALRLLRGLLGQQTVACREDHLASRPLWPLAAAPSCPGSCCIPHTAKITSALSIRLHRDGQH